MKSLTKDVIVAKSLNVPGEAETFEQKKSEEKPTKCFVFSRSVQEASLLLEIVENWKNVGGKYHKRLSFSYCSLIMHLRDTGVRMMD